MRDGLVAEFAGFRVQVVGTLVILQGDHQDDRFLYNCDQALTLARFFRDRDPEFKNALLEAVQRTGRARAQEHDGEAV